MLSVHEVVKKTSEFFASKGIESPRLNAELLVGHALGLRRMDLYLRFEQAVGDAELAALREMVRRRGRREPLQYVLGHADFHGLKLKVDRRALIPRPETELLVETAVGRMASAPARILDLGTGSGAIALALARAYPDAAVVATDRSPDCLVLAAENAETNGLAGRVEFVASDWFQGLLGRTFDLIVSNPPYLSQEEVRDAAPEVREHEPHGALSSDDGGFADLSSILGEALTHLSEGGLLALETGISHHPRATEIAARSGYARSESVRDLSGRDRIFLAWR